MEDNLRELEEDLSKAKRGRPRKEVEPKEDIFDKDREDIVKDAINDKMIDELGKLGLTQEQQDFVLYYLESYNATQAYLKSHGGDKKYATLYGYKVLKSPNVQSAIRKMKKILSIGYDIDPTRYLETQLKIANADIGDYIKFSEEEVPMYNEDGTIMFDPDTGEQKFKKVNRMHLVDSETIDSSVIQSIKQGRDGITIQLMDKMKAWENIKNFFEWKVHKEKETKADSGIIEAINNSSKDSWKQEEIYDDLDEAIKSEE